MWLGPVNTKNTLSTSSLFTNPYSDVTSQWTLLLHLGVPSSLHFREQVYHRWNHALKKWKLWMIKKVSPFKILLVFYIDNKKLWQEKCDCLVKHLWECESNKRSEEEAASRCNVQSHKRLMLWICCQRVILQV